MKVAVLGVPQCAVLKKFILILIFIAFFSAVHAVLIDQGIGSETMSGTSFGTAYTYSCSYAFYRDSVTNWSGSGQESRSLANGSGDSRSITCSGDCTQVYTSYYPGGSSTSTDTIYADELIIKGGGYYRPALDCMSTSGCPAVIQSLCPPSGMTLVDHQSFSCAGDEGPYSGTQYILNGVCAYYGVFQCPNGSSSINNGYWYACLSHNECFGSYCTSMFNALGGDNNNHCNLGASECSNPTHNVCSVNTCTAVLGGGFNECTPAGGFCGLLNGVCGTANGRSYFVGADFNGGYSLCAAGTPSPLSPVLGNTAGANVSWQCMGSGGGSSPSCSASRIAAPVNGVCGTANGRSYFVGADFNGGYSLCSAGVSIPATPVLVNTVGANVSWDCNGLFGGSKASCSASRIAAPITGACGSANGRIFSYLEAFAGSYTLCTAGILHPSNPSLGPNANDTVSWDCNGSGGGSDAVCSASRSGPVANGQCGDANGTIHLGALFPAAGANLCSAGTPPTITPTLGNNINDSNSWICAGQNGGTTVNCSVIRVAAVCTGSVPSNSSFCAGSSSGLLMDTTNSLVGNTSASCGGTKCAYFCPAGYHQNGSVCDADVCLPKTCSDYPGQCGPSFSNGCGGYIDCSLCAPGKSCIANVCTVVNFNRISDFNARFDYDSNKVILYARCYSSTSDANLLGSSGTSYSFLRQHTGCNVMGTDFNYGPDSLLPFGKVLQLTLAIPQPCNPCEKHYNLAVLNTMPPSSIPDNGALAAIAVLSVCVIVFLAKRSK